MSNPVKVAVDGAGHLVLPEVLREKAGLKPGVPFEVTARQGHIEMKRAESEVRLVRQGRLTIAVADDDLPPLTEQEVLELREEIRRSRAGS